jgi:hypothetical protein
MTAVTGFCAIDLARSALRSLSIYPCILNTSCSICKDNLSQNLPLPSKRFDSVEHCGHRQIIKLRKLGVSLVGVVLGF